MCRNCFELVQGELRRSGYEELLSSGLVLSGGTAQLAGICELGDEVFHLPVRVGVPNYHGSLADVVCQSQYANVMGLVLEGAAQRRRGLQARDTRSFRHTFERMKGLAGEKFLICHGLARFFCAVRELVVFLRRI